ncbi:MAG: DUF2142 domain-containing protein [Eubacterium sp.]|jgi:uncharacterized membrane protein|nr:DUF2142 domain-containing protein [Eubacterium sp.]
MHKLSRKNRIEIAALTVIFIVAAVLVYKTTILTRMMLPRTATQVSAEEEYAYMLSDGDHLEQTFVYPLDELLSAGIRISMDEDAWKRLLKEDKKRDLGTLRLKILDAEKNMVMSADYAVCVLADDQNLVASFSGTQTGWADHPLTIVLDAENIHEDVKLAIGYTTNSVAGAQLSINGESEDFTLNIQTADRQFLYWKLWGAFGAVLVYILLLGTYLSLAVFRMKPEKVFLVTGGMLALIYMLLLPPLSVPDEEVHLKQAYEYTSRIMGREASKHGTVVMDKEDFHAMQMFETTPSLPEYDRLKDEILKSGRESGTIEIPHTDTRAPAVVYVPGMIGILLGRILGLNGILVIYLGRICSILFYLMTMYWFIRLANFARAAAFVIAVLPMTVQQCCSYSYDSVVIEFVFLYLALLFRLIYEKQAIKRSQIAAYALFMILLSVCKGGMYMPLCLLTLLIPADRFYGRKKKIIFTGCMAAAAVAAFLTTALRNVLYVVNPTAQQTADAYLAGENYGVAGLLADPMEFILLSVRTLFLSGSTFLENMFGSQLGWLDINVSRIVVYGMLLLTGLSILQMENGSSYSSLSVTIRQKRMFLLVIALSAAMVFATMFISWTPRESTEIFGIQGRYFLPLLPLVLMLFHGKSITIKKDISRKIMFSAVCLQCVAIYDILLSLERIL